MAKRDTPKRTAKPRTRKTLELYLVRHGEADGQAPSEELGSPLTVRGRQQARRVAKRLAGMSFDHIYTSNLSRAHETAQAISVFHPATPLTVTKDIREVGSHHAPEVMNNHRGWRKERLDQLETVQRFIRRLYREHRHGQRLLLAIHGNLIRLIVPLLGKIDPALGPMLDVNNTSVTIVQWRRNHPPWILLANCTRHLRADQIT